MKTGIIIRYIDLCLEEGGRQIQKGMNFGLGGSYSVVLCSFEKNAPYNDEMDLDGTIKYEGHDVYSGNIEEKKNTDQPLKTSAGTLMENGKFFRAADAFKEGREEAAKIRVYRKLRVGVWVHMGFYDLIDAVQEYDGRRNVFKFFFKPDSQMFDPDDQDNMDRPHSRIIPGPVMQEVYIRDKGQCQQCLQEGRVTKDNLHFDHTLHYSRGGTSLKPENIRLLCARHNLSRGNRFSF